MRRADGLLIAAWAAPVALWMWLAMLLTHELGHVLAAHATGGVVVATDVQPGRLPHTLVRPNPHPSCVLWGGFLVGWAAPQLTAPAWRIEPCLLGPTLRAWAAFCLLAGGVYLAAGGAERLTDTGQLVAAGWNPALLVAVGAAVTTLGYARSRSAWIAIAKRWETDPITPRVTAAWWLALAAWIGLQGGLNRVIQPPP